MNYYVYAYLRNDGTPYYIGKGVGKRAWSKGKGEIGKPTDSNRILIVEKNLTLTGSLAIERRLICWYGRKDIGTGILRNKTDGGDGGTGATVGNKLSDETKRKISQSLKGKKQGPMSEESKSRLSASLKGKNLGKVRTDEQRKAMSDQQKGRKGHKHSEETKQKLREANLGKHVNAFTEEHKQKISTALKGKPKKKESVEKQRKKLIGRVPSQTERKSYLDALERGKTACQFCGKICILGNYRRWHGNNCKSKNT